MSNDSNVVVIGPNTEFKTQLDEAVPLVGLDTLHTLGFEGAGIQVATIDTGVDGAHLDLFDSLIDEQCFCAVGCCPGGASTQSGPGAASDDNGHGTRVAGIITSNGTSAPLGGANGTDLTRHGFTDSTTSADQVTCFSNSSATTDVMAPGAPMTSSLNGGGTSTNYGTSYAAPTVTACAAVLLGTFPGVSPDDMTAALITSSSLAVDAKNGLSYPRLDCPTASSALAPKSVPGLSPSGLALVTLFLLGVARVGMRGMRNR